MGKGITLYSGDPVVLGRFIWFGIGLKEPHVISYRMFRCCLRFVATYMCEPPKIPESEFKSLFDRIITYNQIIVEPKVTHSYNLRPRVVNSEL